MSPVPESATVRVYTAERMKAIEDACIVNARIETGEDSARNLILIKHDGTLINVGNVGGTGSVVTPPPTGETPGLVTAIVQGVV